MPPCIAPPNTQVDAKSIQAASSTNSTPPPARVVKLFQYSQLLIEHQQVVQARLVEASQAARAMLEHLQAETAAARARQAEANTCKDTAKRKARAQAATIRGYEQLIEYLRSAPAPEADTGNDAIANATAAAAAAAEAAAAAARAAAAHRPAALPAPSDDQGALLAALEALRGTMSDALASRTAELQAALDALGNARDDLGTSQRAQAEQLTALTVALRGLAESKIPSPGAPSLVPHSSSASDAELAAMRARLAEQAAALERERVRSAALSDAQSESTKALAELQKQLADLRDNMQRPSFAGRLLSNEDIRHVSIQADAPAGPDLSSDLADLQRQIDQLVRAPAAPGPVRLPGRMQGYCLKLQVFSAWRAAAVAARAAAKPMFMLVPEWRTLPARGPQEVWSGGWGHAPISAVCTWARQRKTALALDQPDSWTEPLPSADTASFLALYGLRARASTSAAADQQQAQAIRHIVNAAQRAASALHASVQDAQMLAAWMAVLPAETQVEPSAQAGHGARVRAPNTWWQPVPVLLPTSVSCTAKAVDAGWLSLPSPSTSTLPYVWLQVSGADDVGTLIQGAAAAGLVDAPARAQVSVVSPGFAWASQPSPATPGPELSSTPVWTAGRALALQKTLSKHLAATGWLQGVPLSTALAFQWRAALVLPWPYGHEAGSQFSGVDASPWSLPACAYPAADSVMVRKFVNAVESEGWSGAHGTALHTRAALAVDISGAMQQLADWLDGHGLACDELAMALRGPPQAGSAAPLASEQRPWITCRWPHSKAAIDRAMRAIRQQVDSSVRALASSAGVRLRTGSNQEVRGLAVPHQKLPLALQALDEALVSQPKPLMMLEWSTMEAGSGSVEDVVLAAQQALPPSAALAPPLALIDASGASAALLDYIAPVPRAALKEASAVDEMEEHQVDPVVEQHAPEPDLHAAKAATRHLLSGVAALRALLQAKPKGWRANRAAADVDWDAADDSGEEGGAPLSRTRSVRFASSASEGDDQVPGQGSPETPLASDEWDTVRTLQAAPVPSTGLHVQTDMPGGTPVLSSAEDEVKRGDKLTGRTLYKRHYAHTPGADAQAAAGAGSAAAAVAAATQVPGSGSSADTAPINHAAASRGRARALDESDTDTDAEETAWAAQPAAPDTPVFSHSPADVSGGEASRSHGGSSLFELSADADRSGGSALLREALSYGSDEDATAPAAGRRAQPSGVDLTTDMAGSDDSYGEVDLEELLDG